MGRWLSAADPSPTAGRCAVEKKLPKGSRRVGFPSPRLGGWRVLVGGVWVGRVGVGGAGRERGNDAGEKGEA